MPSKVKHKASYTNEVTPLEEANKAIAYKAALEGIVMLTNDGILPLTPGKIALFGAGAGMTIKGGTGSGEVNERHAVSVLEGLENAGFTVTTPKWIKEYARLYAEAETRYGVEFRKKLTHFSADVLNNWMSNPFRYPFGSPITQADIDHSQTDTCIYVVARQAGEGADRKLDNGDNSLSEVEKANIVLCAKNYDKMTVVVNVGSSFDMNFVDEIPGINAVIFLCQQGTMGGQAFADLICGKATPSGKLSDTWAYRYEDIPFAKKFSYLNGNLTQEYYREGIYVGYRYFDTFVVKPRYPFGYGLSYTNFTRRFQTVAVDKTTVTLTAEVTNTGKTYAGQEVLQLYVSCPQGKLPKEKQRLVAFAKTALLSPGETETLTLRFDWADLASFRESDATMLLEAGPYLLRLGNSSQNTQICAALRLDAEAVVSTHSHVCERKKPVPEITAPQGLPETLPENLLCLTISAADIVTYHHHYRNPPVSSSPVGDRLLNRLSLAEQISLVVGGGLGGARYFEAPGSAGTTTGKLLHKGIPNVCMADGPAGLRLQKRSALTKSGKIKAIDPIISLMKYFPPFIKRFLLADPRKNTLVYQFTTAFPVGMALAQTWNLGLAEEVGRAVSAEMSAYGVNYWLAPALNIHRNPLCGRNFEYYSEDPLLSGKLAAAMTRGVQSIKGNYVTLKHFCCNNQEDNRNKTNANVNERALREIYLRGFEIAVKESRPGAVMSSYNKVNGTYTSNSYDLLTKVLRNEWGFDRLVMTDWFATGKGLAGDALALSAGNDLIMPGLSGSRKAIDQALKDNLIQKEDVRRCAANILKGICSTQVYREFRQSRKK